MEPKIQNITHESQTSSSSSAAAQMVASVDDLLTEIFLRLPMKSLIRFKSVSKHWQSLISDPGFTILRNPNPNPAAGLILEVPHVNQLRPESDPYAYIVSFDNTGPQMIRTLKFINPCPYGATIIISSCNGLILTCRCYKPREYHRTRYDYYVCNPTTNSYSKLPRKPDDDEPDLRPMSLAFDPSKSPHYKVVCPFGFQFVVYSSETGFWRKSRAEPLQDNTSVYFKSGVYWNGAMHWVSFTKAGKSIYFDPDGDRMSEEMMPTPPILHHNNSPHSYFGESCGHLHYIDDCRNWMQMDVYELRRDYSEWFRKYTINHDYSSNMPCVCAVVRSKTHDDDDDDSFSVFLIGGTLVRYSFRNKTRENICIVGGAPLEQCSPRVDLTFQHAESLCSV